MAGPGWRGGAGGDPDACDCGGNDNVGDFVGGYGAGVDDSVGGGGAGDGDSGGGKGMDQVMVMAGMDIYSDNGIFYACPYGYM